MVHENSANENNGMEYVTAHMLGLEKIYTENECILAFMRSADLSIKFLEETCNEEGIHSLLPIPIQKQNEWNLVFTSPVFNMNDGSLKLALIGEVDKIW